MIIAVDFDGTIVEHKYPEIGRERPFAITTLKMLIEQRHLLILWTVRKGHLLQEAVDWCKERGVEFYAVNKNYPEEQVETDAEIFIDDCNLGGIPDWGKIYQMITEKKSWEDIYHSAPVEETPKKKKKGWFW